MSDRTMDHPDFQRRLASREEELSRLFSGLYHGDQAAYGRFLDMLFRLWQERPEALKALDRAREGDPLWYRDRRLVGMLIYVRGFAGTLKGLRKKLDYIADCGVNCLHLMPLLESPAGRDDGGFAVSDFRKVQPELGTMKDLSALAEDCRARGISLCLDFVMNHTGEDHEWARRARAGEKEYQDRYFFFDDWTLPNAFEQTVPQVFPVTAPGSFTWCEDCGKVVMTTFHPYQWDLNYANPAVLTDMADNMLNLCNQGAEIIRLDALPYIWKALGTSCRNLPQVHTLARILRLACEIVCPAALLLGEVVMEPDRVAPYFGSPETPECHLLCNVTAMATLWHTVASGDVRLLSHQLEQLFALPKEYAFLNYLRCHDDIGWGLDFAFLSRLGQQEVPHKRYLNDYLTGRWPGSPARGELYNDDPRLGDARLCGTTASLCGMEAARASGSKKAMDEAIGLDVMLHAFIFTLSGIPVLYGGDEIARENDYSYHADPDRRDDSRWLHRGPMDWKKAALRTRKNTPEERVFSALRQLEQLRAGHAAFDAEADTWILRTVSEQVLGIGRYCRGEQLLALFNFCGADQDIWLLDDKVYTDLVTGAETAARTVRVPAHGFRWLLHTFK